MYEEQEEGGRDAAGGHQPGARGGGDVCSSPKLSPSLSLPTLIPARLSARATPQPDRSVPGPDPCPPPALPSFPAPAPQRRTLSSLLSQSPRRDEFYNLSSVLLPTLFPQGDHAETQTNTKNYSDPPSLRRRPWTEHPRPRTRRAPLTDPHSLFLPRRTGCITRRSNGPHSSIPRLLDAALSPCSASSRQHPPPLPPPLAPAAGLDHHASKRSVSCFCSSPASGRALITRVRGRPRRARPPAWDAAAPCPAPPVRSSPSARRVQSLLLGDLQTLLNPLCLAALRLPYPASSPPRSCSMSQPHTRPRFAAPSVLGPAVTLESAPLVRIFHALAAPLAVWAALCSAQSAVPSLRSPGRTGSSNGGSAMRQHWSRAREGEGRGQQGLQAVQMEGGKRGLGGTSPERSRRARGGEMAKEGDGRSRYGGGKGDLTMHMWWMTVRSRRDRERERERKRRATPRRSCLFAPSPRLASPRHNPPAAHLLPPPTPTSPLEASTSPPAALLATPVRYHRRRASMRARCEGAKRREQAR